MKVKHKILIIEDEVSIRKMLVHMLPPNDYQVIEAIDGENGLMLASSHHPDVILLDLALPDKSGEVVLKELRQWTQTPVIILTANKTDEDKVMLLDLGADDYLVKPFHGPELLARIRVAIRHLEKNHSDPILTFGALVLDLAASMVKVKGEHIKLTNKEYQFFSILVKNAGKIVTQKQILDEIWGENNEDKSHYLRVYVAQLRKKVESVLNKKVIITEPGIGYRFEYKPM
jgi:two-component system KDP operon response regulator KdpE